MHCMCANTSVGALSIDLRSAFYPFLSLLPRVRVSMSQSPPSTASAFRPTPEGMHVVYSSAFRPAEACPTLAGQGSFPVAAATSPPAGITSSFPGDQLQASQMHIQYVLVDPSVFRTMTPNPAAIHGAPGHPTPIRQVSPASPAPLILQPMLGLPSMMMSAPPPMIISPPSAAMEPAHVYPYRTMVTTPTTTTEAGRRSSILPDAVKEVEQGAETSSQSSPSPTMDGRGEPPALISKRPAQHRPAHSSDSGKSPEVWFESAVSTPHMYMRIINSDWAIPNSCQRKTSIFGGVVLVQAFCHLVIFRSVCTVCGGERPHWLILCLIHPSFGN